MKVNLRKNIEFGILFGLICAILLSFAKFESRCEELRNGVLRLHIVANSDSEADQNLKLAVRDEILKNSTQFFKECVNVDDAILAASNNIEDINFIANNVLRRNGFDYNANVYVGDKFFGTREYDDFTLPAGMYKSIIVDLGEAKGKNWWCVVFPCVCAPTASDVDLSDSVTIDAANVAKSAPEYQFRFKTIEFYERIKKKFSKK